MALIGLARRSRPLPPDPFRVLETQSRLSRLSAELEVLDRARCADTYALAFRLHALLLAYHYVLEEACRLAEVPVTVVDGPGARLLAEAHLAAAGWSW